MNNGITLQGKLQLKVADSTGRVLHEVSRKNLIVNTSLAEIMKFIAGDQASISITHLAIGDGKTVQTPSDSSLVSEKARLAVTKKFVNSLSLEYKANWGIGAATGTYYEAGMFSASVGGNLFNRTTFPAVVVEHDSQLIATWTITISATEA